MSRGIQERTDFDFIRYSNCWEDPALLLGAMPLEGKNCLSIASAGDNSFSLLAASPAKVVAFDLNPVQLALAELKKCAIARLEYDVLLKFLGFAPSTERLDIYAQLRPHLPPRAAAYFDSHRDLLAAGVIHQGKFEHYFQLFGRRLLPLVHSRKNRLKLLAPKPEAERLAFYAETWNNFRFRLLFRLFFNRFVMGRLGRDPEFFKYVDRHFIANSLKKRTEYALTVLPTHDNPYLRYIVTGGFKGALPHYLRKENIGIIRRNLDALELFQGTPEEVAKHYRIKFDFFNLSDIFEYMDLPLVKNTAEQLYSLAAPGARLAYYNMMAERRLSECLPGRLTELTELSENLFRQNQAFFYCRYLVDEVREEGK